ncbi:MAG TPA: CrcB family protein [Flavobacteriales bacterium]|nr:CrcB family protein [Flavobacteriales bacterium]HNU57979.1 CrcB family protein [Flavobacteriales bacterium]
MMGWLAVFLGGGAGSVLRYAISLGLFRVMPRTWFPWATLSANLLATALLAWLVLRFEVHAAGKEHWRTLLAIGFCGGFSTMSTFNAENYQLLRDGFVGYAAVNIIVSVGAGILLFHLFARSA